MKTVSEFDPNYNLRFYRTRYPELVYAKQAPGLWSFFNVHLGEKARVGPHYASKAELLADLNRYATEFGL